MSQDNTPPLPERSGDDRHLTPSIRPSRFAPVRPDWNLCVRRKGEEGRWQKIGAGWSNERGGISLRIDDNVNLDWWDVFGGDWSIYLFPTRERARLRGGAHGDPTGEV